MNTKTKWLLLTGLLCLSFTMFTKPFMTVPASIGDFLKGFGLSLAAGALIVAGKIKMKKSN